MKNYSALFAFLFFLSASAQTVSTQFGKVQGHLNGTVHEFLGIPFAKPPVDSLRWRAPQNPDSWSDTLNAAAFAPACPQKYFGQINLEGSTSDSTIGNEDCLYLNVWTPQVGSGNLPVLVFIHGGGNQQGSASEISAGTYMYFGKNMSARGNAVIVTIQYRLGPLGFLVHPALDSESVTHTSGNYAVLDQILALKWIKNNIANFGGDTTKTMIFGESAGGVDVGNLLGTPLASGLFSRACIESAAPVLNDYVSAESSGVSFVDTFTSAGTNAQKIAYMRSLPADSLVQYETQPLEGGIAQMNWGAVLDHVVFQNFLIPLVQSGNYNKVPLMIGSNSEETSLTIPQTVTPAMVNALVSTSFPPAYQSEVLALYPAGNNDSTARAAYVGITTDEQFTANTRRTARCVSMNQSEPVWRYFFTYKYPAPQLAALNTGSYHGMELFYVFNTWENISGHQLLFQPKDDSMQQVMLNYWVNFARTGNPNGTQPILANWSPYNASQDNYMELKILPDGTQRGIRTAQCNMWDSLAHFSFCQPPADTSTGINEIANDEFLIYPNPAQNNFIVESSQQNFDVEVFDFTGRKIVERKNISRETAIDCSQFSNGIYFLQSGNTVKKIVVCR